MKTRLLPLQLPGIHRAICLPVFGSLIASSAFGAEIFSEDFEGLPLGPNVDEVTAGDNVWTNVPPENWEIDNSNLAGFDQPGSGVTEWKGWTFADRDWWVSAAGDQRRSEFVNAVGTIAVADPDEWDDLGSPAALGTFESFLSTPPISLAGIAANTVTLAFDSSWRPEVNQTATVTVSYDGGAPVEILRFESNGANIHPDLPNEAVVIPLNNPAGVSEMVITFGLFDAGNNWWWAIDNIVVTTDAVPICPRSLTNTVDREAGTVTLNWLAAANIPGASIEVVRDGSVIDTLPLDANTYTDTPPGTNAPGTIIFDYMVRVVGGGNTCAPLAHTALYQLGAPVMLAEWLLDENQGLVINNNLDLTQFQGQFFSAPGSPAGPGQDPTWTDADFLGTGVKFDGFGYFDVGDTDATAGLRPEFAVTVASWVKPDDFVEWAGIFNMAFDSGSEEAGYYLGTRTGDFHFAVTPESLSGTLFYLRSPGVIGEWQYVVGVYDGVAIRLYLNGIEVASVPASGPILYESRGNGSVPLGGHIGSFIDDNEDLRFLGTIAYLAVWDGALGPNEIQQLYQSGLAGDFGGEPLRITDIDIDTERGEVSLTWNSRNGQIYAVDFSTDMVIWNELDDGVTSDGEATSFTDGTLPPGTTAAYYRIREAN